MAEGGVKVTIENPNAEAEASAEAAAAAAREAEATARHMAEAAARETAEEIREHEEAVDTLEEDVSWLKTQATATQAAIVTLAETTASSLGALAAQVSDLTTRLTPPQVLAEVSEAEVEPAKSVEENQGPKTKLPSRKLI